MHRTNVMSTQDHKALPSVVVPPEGWTLHHDKWGFMGRDSSPGGRLVRLADVLQHIEQNRALSRADALSVLADGLREDDGRSVFILRPGDSPRQLTKADYFGFPAPAVAPAPASATGWARDEPRRKGPFAGFGSDEWRSEAFRVVPDGMTTYQPHAPGPKPRKASTVQPGVQALIERMKLDWLKAGKGRVLPSMDDEAKPAARFAVLMNRAHEFWGYGRLQPLQPPASWCLKSKFGYMACDGEPEGLLVRLDDVVAWIEEAKKVPPKKAHEMVEEAIGTLTNADLFNLSEDDYASPFDGREDFAIIQTLGDAKDPDELGIASLKVWLSGGFCPYVAVRMVRAHELWGYAAPTAAASVTSLLAPLQLVKAGQAGDGGIKTYADLKTFRLATPKAKWLDDMKVIMAEEKHARSAKPGAKGVAQAMADELKVSRKFVDDKVREGAAIIKKRQAAQATTTKHRA